jgi:hypothetical protein
VMMVADTRPAAAADSRRTQHASSFPSSGAERPSLGPQRSWHSVELLSCTFRASPPFLSISLILTFSL